MLLKSLYAMLIFAKNVIPSSTVEGKKKKKRLECRFNIFCFTWGIHRITQYLIIVADMLHLVKENCWKNI